MLSDAVNLTNLHFDCEITYGGPGRVARQLYRDGFRWLEAFGGAKGSLDAGVDVITFTESSLSPRGMRHPRPGFEENMEVFKAELRRLLLHGE